MKEAVVSLLGEKMRQLEPQKNSFTVIPCDEPGVELSPYQFIDPSVHHSHIEVSVLEEEPCQAEEHLPDFANFEGNSIDTGPSSAQVEHSIKHATGEDRMAKPTVEHTVENVDNPTENAEQVHIEPGMVVENVEIPSSNIYIYDNPVYLNRLMKDNTCGKRVRHDAPYVQRLGQWFIAFVT